MACFPNGLPPCPIKQSMYGHHHVPVSVSKDTCGASSKQSENMEPLTPVHALSESCPKEAVVGRKGIAPLDPAVISSIAPPAVARKGVVPLEPAGLSPLKEASTVSRKGRRWCEEVKVSTRRWSEVLDEEMDFSVPPQTPPLVGIKEAAGAGAFLLLVRWHTYRNVCAHMLLHGSGAACCYPTPQEEHREDDLRVVLL